LPIVEASHSAKIEGLRRRIGKKACVIALDEIDKLESKELNDILYILKEIGKIGIICISNTRKYLLDLDPRITSRLSFSSISFPLYSNEELLTILKHRIVDCKALYPNSWDGKVIEQIADLAAGDARVAIQTLRNSAIIAEKANRDRITLEDVEKAYEEIKEIKKKYMLEKLGEHYKLIYEIVKKNPEITSRDFYEAYKLEAIKKGLSPQSNRTFNNYVNELISLGYLKVDRAKAKGNVRSFVVA
jgi:Cdc6-like AAA superfamily ATPase